MNPSTCSENGSTYFRISGLIWPNYNKVKLLIELVIVVLLSLYKQRMRLMETLSPNKIKKLFEETLIDMLNNRKKEVYSVMLEAMEDFSLSRAIKEGRKNKFVDEKKILKALSGSK